MATKTAKVERLMNLVIALLSTSRFLTAEKIRDTVIGYGDQSDEAFSRMFERDKSELRDLGIPLETGKVSGFDPVEGYRIKRTDYSLPEVDLTPEEAAAVAVATKLWESPERITAAQNAVLKLRAAGVEVDNADEVTISTGAGPTGLRGNDVVLGELLAAIDVGQAVQFGHRPNPVEAYTLRTVEPWGVVTARGRWYLVGHDVNREATRVFRISRMTDVKPVGPLGNITVPDDQDLRALVDQAIGNATSGGQALVWIADGHATALRRLGQLRERRRVGQRDGDVVELEVGDLGGLAREVAGYGGDALVLEPASLRQDVIARLTAQAGASA